MEEYDTKILILLLVVVFKLLSPDDGNLLPQEPNLVFDDFRLVLLLPQKKLVKDC
jgi:hypothetical protein